MESTTNMVGRDVCAGVRSGAPTESPYGSHRQDVVASFELNVTPILYLRLTPVTFQSLPTWVRDISTVPLLPVL